MCHVTLLHVTTRHVGTRHVRTRHVTRRHVTMCHVTPRHVTPRHVTPRHMILYQRIYSDCTMLVGCLNRKKEILTNVIFLIRISALNELLTLSTCLEH